MTRRFQCRGPDGGAYSLRGFAEILAREAEHFGVGRLKFMRDHKGKERPAREVEHLFIEDRDQGDYFRNWSDSC